MPNIILNPFTGKFDFAGLSSSEADLLYIRLDGTSTTTASIPFALGLTAGSSNQFSVSSSGAVIVNAPFSVDATSGGSNVYFGSVADSFWEGTFAMYTQSGEGADRMYFDSETGSLEAQGTASFVLGQINFKIWYDSSGDFGVFDGRGLTGAETTRAKFFNAVLFNDEIGFGATNTANWINISETSTTHGIVLNVSRNLSSLISPFRVLSQTDTISWTGINTTQGNLSSISIQLTDNRSLTSGIGVDNSTFLYGKWDRGSSFTSNRVNHNWYWAFGTMTDSGTYNNTSATQVLTKQFLNFTLHHGFTYAGSTRTMSYTFNGITFSTSSSPTITSGTLNSVGAIYEATGTGYATGNSYVAILHNTMTGFDTTLFLANATSNSSLVGLDNAKLGFGTGSGGSLANRNLDWDAEIYYNGTNLVINPKVIGSGVLSVLGTIDVSSAQIQMDSDQNFVTGNFFIVNDSSNFTLEFWSSDLEAKMFDLNTDAEVVQFYYTASFSLITSDSATIGSSGLICQGLLNINNTAPKFRLTDSSGTPNDDYEFGLDGGVYSITNITDTRTDLSIDGSGNWTIGASGVSIGIYGVTPTARATTGGSASTFVANTSGIVDDTATWDGYSIGQVVKALRNFGILT